MKIKTLLKKVKFLLDPNIQPDSVGLEIGWTLVGNTSPDP